MAVVVTRPVSAVLNYPMHYTRRAWRGLVWSLAKGVPTREDVVFIEGSCDPEQSCLRPWSRHGRRTEALSRRSRYRKVKTTEIMVHRALGAIACGICASTSAFVVPGVPRPSYTSRRESCSRSPAESRRLSSPSDAGKGNRNLSVSMMASGENEASQQSRREALAGKMLWQRLMSFVPRVISSCSNDSHVARHMLSFHVS